MDIPQVNEDGKNILATLRATRTLFEDVSKMLSTVDAMMRERGWETRASNTCMADLSRTIQSPDYWLPSLVFRYLRHKDMPTKLVAASVILDLVEKPERVREPLISGIVFDYGPGAEPGNDWKYEYAGWHVWMPGSTDDGTPVSAEPKVVWPKDNVRALSVTSFALPLVVITDSDALRGRVVEPLNELARH